MRLCVASLTPKEVVKPANGECLAALASLRAAVSAVRACAAGFGPDEAFTARGLADHLHAMFPRRRSSDGTTPVRMLPMGLLDLPLELISLVLARCDAKTLCRVAASCRLLGLGVPPPPPPRSPVEEALRARAEAGGWWIPASLPEGESSWLSMLAWVETAVERRGRASTSAGAHHSLLLDSRGALLSAGTERPRNHFAHLPASPADGTPGLLGHTQGVVAPGVGAPTLVMPPRAVAALCARPVVAVSAGRHHSLAVTADGAAYSWGNGREGLLGHGDEASTGVPRLIEALRGVRVGAVAAGRMHSLAASREGLLWSWGQNTYEQLGLGDGDAGQENLAPGTGAAACVGGHAAPSARRCVRSPSQVSALSAEKVTLLAAGGDHSAAGTAVGRVYTWGWAAQGQLGRPADKNSPRSVPGLVAALSDSRVTDLSCGACHTLACTARGEVFSWGCGTNGELGHGDSFNRHSPELIEALVTVHACAVAAGEHHSVALSAADGAVFAWGHGRGGRLGLGNGEEGSALLPQRVSALSGVAITSVAAGASHTLAVSAAGRHYAWGSLDALGYENEELRNQPTPAELQLSEQL